MVTKLNKRVDSDKEYDWEGEEDYIEEFYNDDDSLDEAEAKVEEKPKLKRVINRKPIPKLNADKYALFKLEALF